MMKKILTIIVFIAAPTAAFADGIANASIYTVDRLVCGFYVPQSDVDASVVQGMRDRNLTYPQAVDATVQFSLALNARIEQENAKDRWCEMRRAK